jgi:hypothetical protein
MVCAEMVFSVDLEGAGAQWQDVNKSVSAKEPTAVFAQNSTNVND